MVGGVSFVDKVQAQWVGEFGGVAQQQVELLGGDDKDVRVVQELECATSTTGPLMESGRLAMYGASVGILRSGVDPAAVTSTAGRASAKSRPPLQVC